MSTDMMLHSTDEAFVLAERICRSALIPAAYRGKPADAAIAMLYGAEIGIPPMTALQRVVVISGKPTCDAQGLDMLIRSAGHSLTGTATSAGAKVTGKRCDTGDEMTVEWGPEDAKRAGLRSDTYSKFPDDMFWARAVSRLGRRLFADVLLSVSYVPEEAAAIPDRSVPLPEPVAQEPARRDTVRQPPGTTPSPEPDADADTGEIVDAEIVEDVPAPTPPAPAAEATPGDGPSVKQMNMLRAILAKDLGITDNDEIHQTVGAYIGREIDSLKDMTKGEASRAIDTAQQAAKA